MLQAFIITLREGVEASLIVGIVFAYLSKIGRHELKRTVFWALGSAIAASVLGAVVIARTNFNSDIFEGWVMLAAAAFVLSMIWFMHKAAKSMKGEIEGRVAKALQSTNKTALFFFVFLLVLREGVETVLILSAVSLNSTELMSFTGTVLGIAVAVVFGVLFIRGSVRVNLQRFFRVTSVILYFVAFQLIVSGLHELSENGVLPSSQAEMRYIGPIVRNDLFFFVTMLALAALMILMEQRRRAPISTPNAPNPSVPHSSTVSSSMSGSTPNANTSVPHSSTASPSMSGSTTQLTPAQLRKLAWSHRRERLWMTAVVATSFLFIFLSTAEFIYAKSSTALSAATPVTLVGEQVTVPTAEITAERGDATLHRYAVRVPFTDAAGKPHAPEVRFLLYRKPDGTIVSVGDVCTICGPVGFYIGSQGITCKMCASPLVPASMGQPGGCNPIPLKSTNTNGQITIAAADLQALAPRFEK